MGQRVLMPTANVNITGTNASIDQYRTVTGGSAHIIINMLAVPGVQSVSFKLQGKDALGNYYDLGLVSAAILGVSQIVLKIGIGMLAAANLVANDSLPDVWRVVGTHTGAGVFQYNVCMNDLSLN